jgi:RNA polymerase sigma factor (sigma-70 family)
LVTPGQAVDDIVYPVDRSDAELLEKHADELTRFAPGIVGPFDASDVVSGAFLRCMLSARWPSVTNRRAYLYRAVLNEPLATRRSLARRRRREEEMAPPEGTGADEPDPEVLEAVARLSVRQRAVIVLTYWNDLDPKSVATLLGLSEGTVRRYLARARANLKEQLDDKS